MGPHRTDAAAGNCEPDRPTPTDTHHRAMATVIDRYRAGLEKLRAAELERLCGRLPDLNEDSRVEIGQFADRLMARMLHPPLEVLGDRAHVEPPHALLVALERLFQLDE